MIALNILCTLLSFGVFFTHPLAINRQHFSITLLLTQTTADLIIYEALPRGPSFLWIEYFLMISWFFCFGTRSFFFFQVVRSPHSRHRHTDTETDLLLLRTPASRSGPVG